MFAATFSTVEIKRNGIETIITIKPNRSIFFKLMVLIFWAPIIILPIISVVFLLKGERMIRSGLDWIMLPTVVIVLTLFWFKYLKRNFGTERLTITKDKLIYQNNFLGIGKYFETERKKLKNSNTLVTIIKRSIRLKLQVMLWALAHLKMK